MLIVPKHKPIKADMIDWLATVPGFIEGTMSIDNRPVILDDWQRTVITDDSKFVAGIKARQIGWSAIGCAAKALVRSNLINRNLSIFVSMNLDDAREKIIYARDLHESMPSKYKTRLATDNKMELSFSNGSRIITMFMPRGKGPADVYIDEMAFMARAREIYKAALMMTLRGGQLSVASTPLAKIGMYYDIISGAEGKFGNYSIHKIPWYYSTALCRDVKRAIVEAPLMTTKERVYEFGTAALIEIFESTFLEDFQQECELSFQDDQEAFIPIETIFACVDPDLEQYSSYEEFLKKLKGTPWGGFDVGRRKHPSELILLEQLGDKFYHRMTVTMRGKDFDAQKYELSQALEILPIAGLAIDETGIGMNLAEDLQKRYPQIVVPVNFASRVEADTKRRGEKDKKETVAVKERMATEVKITFERRNISIAQDRELIQQIHSVKKETTSLGQIRYSVDKNEKHHGDKFWGLALALLVARPDKRTVWVSPVFGKLGV
jgi:phage FluMu gp28-like protein